MPFHGSDSWRGPMALVGTFSVVSHPSHAKRTMALTRTVTVIGRVQIGHNGGNSRDSGMAIDKIAAPVR